MRHCCDAAVQQNMEVMMSPKIQADYAKAFASFKLPQLDLQALAELQSRNFDAVLQASQILADAGKAVVRQQIELVTAVLEDAVKSSQEVIEAPTPEAKLAKGIDATKASYGRFSAAVKDFAALVGKPGQKAADILQRRLIDNTGELEAMVARAA